MATRNGSRDTSDDAELRDEGGAFSALAALPGLDDPAVLLRSFAAALLDVAKHPANSLPAVARWAAGLNRMVSDVGARVLGVDVDGADADDDVRFRDPAWSDNPIFRVVRDLYRLNSTLLTELVDAANISDQERARAEFAAKLLSDAVAPTNMLLTNPVALRRARETRGRSVVRGMQNMLDDLQHNGGWPRQVDRDAFRVGVDVAVTPGSVVYRNELIEVLQYEPQTPQVHEIPMVLCPPWINRYYVADLAPGKSLVEWLVQHGHTVFAVSYRNPDESMRGIRFEDYLRLGPLSAFEHIRRITGAETVNTTAICLGGSLQASAIAYLDQVGERWVNTATYLNSALDFRQPGVLGDVFVDRSIVDSFAERTGEKGYLPSADMARTFDLLRANDLVFRYVVDGWLLGEEPPAFDLLAWNADGTNIPGEAHRFFLEKMYLENALFHDELELLGTRLQVSKIEVPQYIVAAIADHIVPWRASYETTQLCAGPVRFVLTSAGHIAGIVNPPGPKTSLWTNDDLPADPDEWFAGALKQNDTWWNDWVAWLEPRSGPLRKPRGVGSAKYPALEPAPGKYVLS
jgi:polyhydroxyalkanoate synthase